jgi:hypothetical protein
LMMAFVKSGDHPRHALHGTYTRRIQDGLRRRYWVRCVFCDLRRGPFRTKEQAAGFMVSSIYVDVGLGPCTYDQEGLP